MVRAADSFGAVLLAVAITTASLVPNSIGALCVAPPRISPPLLFVSTAPPFALMADAVLSAYTLTPPAGSVSGAARLTLSVPVADVRLVSSHPAGANPLASG